MIDSNTGEVLKPKFRTIYDGIEPTWQDCSNKFQKRYKEIPPYAIDLETGKFLNKTSQTVLVEDDPFDVDEYIQSFKSECDIYTILEKFGLTDCTDTSLINKGVMSFGDISELPDNFNDMNEYLKSANDFISKFNADTARDILDGKKSADDIQASIETKINLEKSKKKVEVNE